MEYLPSPATSWIWLALVFKLWWLLWVEGGRFLWGLLCLLALGMCAESGALWPVEAVGGVQTGGDPLGTVSVEESPLRGLGVSEIDKNFITDMSLPPWWPTHWLYLGKQNDCDIHIKAWCLLTDWPVNVQAISKIINQTEK